MQQQYKLLAIKQWKPRIGVKFYQRQSFAVIFLLLKAVPSTAIELIQLIIGCFGHLPERSVWHIRRLTVLSCPWRMDSSLDWDIPQLNKCYRFTLHIWEAWRHRLFGPQHTTRRSVSPSLVGDFGCYRPCSNNEVPFVLPCLSHLRLDFVQELFPVLLADPGLHSASVGSYC